MEEMLKVRPVEGRSLPRENAPKSRITEDGTPVPNTPYYRRAIARGDIELASAPKADAPTAKPKPGTPTSRRLTTENDD